jgi:hypothetical protein
MPGCAAARVCRRTRAATREVSCLCSADFSSSITCSALLVARRTTRCTCRHSHSRCYLPSLIQLPQPVTSLAKATRANSTCLWHQGSKIQCQRGWNLRRWLLLSELLRAWVMEMPMPEVFRTVQMSLCVLTTTVISPAAAASSVLSGSTTNRSPSWTQNVLSTTAEP